MPDSEIICTGCPMGCRVTFTVKSSGEIDGLKGNACRVAIKYVATEFRNPVRVFTGTVLTEDGRPVSVKTDKPVVKTLLREISRATSRARLKTPVSMGQVIRRNILGTGADLIATRAD